MKITGRVVLFSMLAFFGVIFAVNGTFMYLAIDSWPGLVSKTPYEDGVNYNQTLTNASQQKALGWQSVVTSKKMNDGRDHVVIKMLDADNQAIAGLKMTVIFKRPVQNIDDINSEFNEVFAGQYETDILLPVDGRWTVVVEASNDTTSYRLDHEIMVAP